MPRCIIEQPRGRMSSECDGAEHPMTLDVQERVARLPATALGGAARATTAIARANIADASAPWEYKWCAGPSSPKADDATAADF